MGWGSLLFALCLMRKINREANVPFSGSSRGRQPSLLSSIDLEMFYYVYCCTILGQGGYNRSLCFAQQHTCFCTSQVADMRYGYTSEMDASGTGTFISYSLIITFPRGSDFSVAFNVTIPILLPDPPLTKWCAFFYTKDEFNPANDL